MIRKHRALVARRETEAAQPVPPAARHTEVDSAAARITHVLNGAREARHEFEQGHKTRAIVDAITAGLDVGTVALFVKDGLNLRGPHDWKSTRKWLGARGIARKRQ